MIYMLLYLAVFSCSFFLSFLFLGMALEIVRERPCPKCSSCLGSVNPDFVLIPVAWLLSTGLGYWFTESVIGWHASAVLGNVLLEPSNAAGSSSTLGAPDATLALERGFWRGVIVSIPVGIVTSVVGNVVYERLLKRRKQTN